MVDIQSLVDMCLKVGHQNDLVTKKNQSEFISNLIMCSTEADAKRTSHAFFNLTFSLV